MTAWDMVSIAIDLTGGFVAGLLFPVWLAKHEVFLFSSEAQLWGSSRPLAPLGYRSPVSLDGMSSLCISRDCIVSCLTRLLNPVSRLPNPDRFPANFMGPGKPASLPGFRPPCQTD